MYKNLTLFSAIYNHLQKSIPQIIFKMAFKNLCYYIWKKNFISILESIIFLYIADNKSESNVEIQIQIFFKECLTDLNFTWKNLSAGNAKCLYC